MSLFDINTTDIPADELRAIRMELTRTEHERVDAKHSPDYPTQHQMSHRLGLADAIWCNWEQRGANGAAAALVRLHFGEGATFDESAYVSPEEVEQLVRFVMEVCELPKMTRAVTHVAQELDVRRQTVGNWLKRGAPESWARLLRYLLDEFGLSAQEAA